MRQSIADGVTLEIVCEGRTHNAEVPDKPGMDASFTDVFSEYNLQERTEILGYCSRAAYLEADPTIEASPTIRTSGSAVPLSWGGSIIIDQIDCSMENFNLGSSGRLT